MNVASSSLVIDSAKRPQDVVDLEERSLLARHCRGDTDAFPALMSAYRRPVYSYLVRNGVAEADRDAQSFSRPHCSHCRGALHRFT